MKAFLEKAWYQQARNPLWFLYPLSILFRILFLLRKIFYKSGLLPITSIPVPLIVVGNITVGGTGKTPTVIALVNYLKSKGFRPGVVSRGYGGTATDFPLLVSSQSPVSETGDEPMLIFKSTGVPVVIDPRRARAAKLLSFEGACDVIISDDGLQHFAMARDFEIIVVDGERLLGNEKLLPMGPLREPANRLADSDLVVVNTPKAGAINYISQLAKSKPIVELSLERETLEAVNHNNMGELPIPNTQVHAVAGIGNPKRFFSSLEAMGFDIIPHPFDDHYDFKESDLYFSDGLPVIMTEKDAIKCSAFKNDKLWYLPVTAHLGEKFYTSINQFLDIQ